MLRPVDEDGSSVFIDLVDHSELTTSGRAKTIELTPERLPRSLRVLRDRSEDRLDDRRSNLRRQSIEMPEAFRRDLDLVHDLDAVLERESLTLGRLSPRRPDRSKQCLVFQDADRFLERFQVIGRQEDGSRHAVPRDDEPLVLAGGAVNKFREVSLRLGERNRLAHDWSVF